MREEAFALFHQGTVIPAIPLVLDENRKFNEEGQRTLVRYYLASGVGGVAVAVHTTQFEIRDKGTELLEPVLRITKEEIDTFTKKTGKTVLAIAGACGPTQQAVKEAALAKSLGFDAVLLSPGGLPDYTEDDMLERTRAVARELSVIGFYLQNSVGGRRLSFEYWRTLANIENVIGIKAAPFNRYQTIDLVRGVAFSERSDQVALYTGNDDNIVVDLLTPYTFTVEGKKVTKYFVGGLLGHWSVWTHNVVTLFEDIKKVQGKDIIPAELLERNIEVTDANGAFFDVNNNFAGCIPGVHEVLRRQGLLEGNWCLNPDEVLSPGQREEISRVWEAYPNLNDDAFVEKLLEEN